jgi:hypothetical protein
MTDELKMTMTRPPECYENDITLTADQHVDDENYIIDLSLFDGWEELTIMLTKDRAIELKNWLESKLAG